MSFTAAQPAFEAAAQEAEAFARDAQIYRTLLESTRAIPWSIDWATMTFDYMGPQIEDVLGWKQGSWRSVDDWVQRMHPDDREASVNYCIAQSQAGVDHEMDYRALTSSGDYVWIRDVIHVVRGDDGTAQRLVGFMFDISERKRSEEELLRLQRELEKLSLTDGLTGIANRRLFDSRLAEEWERSCREVKPLSVLLIDLDYFKQYNDHYGHVEGDECLKAVAGALASVADRPGDVVARFGGEEFAVLLPDTDAEQAQVWAEDFASAICGLARPHPSSDAGEQVTASIGVVTATCNAQDEMRKLVETADQLLYIAKKNGRARVEARAL